MKNIFYFIIIFLLGQSCYPLTKMDSARTVGKGNLGYDNAFYYQRFPVPLDTTIKDIEHLFRPQSQFYFDMAVKYGASDKMDIAIEYKFPFYIGMNTKFRILGSNSSTYGLATGISFIRNFASNASSTFTETKDVDFNPPKHILSFPLFISFFKEPFHSFFIPQYSIVIDKNRRDIFNYQFLGMTMGWGFKMDFMEFNTGVSYYRSLFVERHVFAFGFGYKYYFIRD